MTDIHLAASPTASVLASVLTSENPHPEVSVFRGVLTPVELDVRSSETAALVSAAAVHDLGWLRRIAVRGEDRFRWLSGMVTNTVNGLAPNAGAWNLVLNAQGRIQGDLTVWRDGENLELEMDADQHDRLMAHLDRFIIMDDVELVASGSEAAIGLTGPRVADVLGRLGLPLLAEPLTQTSAEWDGIKVLIRRGYGVLADHYALWVPTEKITALWQVLLAAGAQPAGSAALEAFRIAEGIPAYGTDIAERDLAQETSQMRGLSFDKGCYLGQEIVERIRSRGNVHRHLRPLELDGPVPAAGTKLTQDGADAGTITGAAELSLAAGTRVFAIGMIRAEAEVRKAPLTYSTNAESGTTGEVTGTAKVLAAPPTFRFDRES